MLFFFWRYWDITLSLHVVTNSGRKVVDAVDVATAGGGAGAATVFTTTKETN